MTKFTVLLKDETVGEVTADSVQAGDVVTVSLHDEDGMPVKVTGEVDSILHEQEF